MTAILPSGSISPFIRILSFSVRCGYGEADRVEIVDDKSLFERSMLNQFLCVDFELCVRQSSLLFDTGPAMAKHPDSGMAMPSLCSCSRYLFTMVGKIKTSDVG